MRTKVVNKIPAHNNKYISAASLTRQRNAAATYLRNVSPSKNPSAVIYFVIKIQVFS